METVILKIFLIAGGFFLLPILGCLIEHNLKHCYSKLGITCMLIGSLVSLAGFGLCVSWNCICMSCGSSTALVVFLVAWLSFLFLAFSAYSTQLEK